VILSLNYLDDDDILTNVQVIAEFARVTSVSSSNFFLKLDALTSKLLAFFWDKSNMNNQLELEMGILNKMVGIISSSNFSSVHQLLVMARA